MAYRRTPHIQARIDSQRAAILDAAAQLLAEQGFKSATLAAVAARSDLATGTVYRHFVSKSELLAEVFRLLVGREVRAVRDAALGVGRPSERVLAVLETFALRAFKSPVLAYALLVEPVDVAVEQQRLLFRREFRDLIADVIREGVADGSLVRQDAELCAAALVGATAEALVGPLASRPPTVWDGHQALGPLDSLLEFAHRALGSTTVGGSDAGHP